MLHVSTAGYRMDKFNVKIDVNRKFCCCCHRKYTTRRTKGGINRFYTCQTFMNQNTLEINMWKNFCRFWLLNVFVFGLMVNLLMAACCFRQANSAFCDCDFF